MLTITAPGDTLDHRHRLGAAESFIPADPARRFTSRPAHHADEAAASRVAAGALAEDGQDGASS